jgi:hypothetical protein
MYQAGGDGAFRLMCPAHDESGERCARGALPSLMAAASLARPRHKAVVTVTSRPSPSPARRTFALLYSSNRSLVPVDFAGAIEASGVCAALPWSRKRLTIG